MQPPSKSFDLQRAVSGFANTAAAIGALLLVPYVALHFRDMVYYYILSSMSYGWAYWGSWLFVALTAIGCYFGSSALLQVIVQLMFRRGSGYKGGF